MFFVSVLGGWIVPDKSRNTNEQHPTISLRPPFFKTPTLLYKSGKQILSSVQYEIDINDEGATLKNHYGNTSFKKTTDLAYPDDKPKNIVQKTFWLGTDKYGRDVLSRLIIGIRVSLLVGFLAVLVSLIVGIPLGAMAGFYGGMVDQSIMFFINATWSIPTLLLVFAIVLALGKSVAIIFLAVGLTLWVDVARIVRGQVLSVKEEQYVQATRSLAFSAPKIIFSHILPNIIGSILVISAANFAIAILIEAGLSYLGFGVQPPAPSIGNMLYENYGYAVSGKVYLAMIPALMIMSLVLAFNLIGTGLRDIFDVRSK